MNINNMTRKEFEALPYVPWDAPVRANGLILLPERKLHDSGYRCLSFIADCCDDTLAKLGGCSDVTHLGGICGFGCENWVEKYGECPTSVPPVPWSIDCLPKSGLLRLFAPQHILILGPSLSSFEVFVEPRGKK